MMGLAQERSGCGHLMNNFSKFVCLIVSHLFLWGCDSKCEQNKNDSFENEDLDFWISAPLINSHTTRSIALDHRRGVFYYWVSTDIQSLSRVLPVASGSFNDQNIENIDYLVLSNEFGEIFMTKDISPDGQLMKIVRKGVEKSSKEGWILIPSKEADWNNPYAY